MIKSGRGFEIFDYMIDFLKDRLVFYLIYYTNDVIA